MATNMLVGTVATQNGLKITFESVSGIIIEEVMISRPSRLIMMMATQSRRL